MMIDEPEGAHLVAKTTPGAVLAVNPPPSVFEVDASGSGLVLFRARLPSEAA